MQEVYIYCKDLELHTEFHGLPFPKEHKATTCSVFATFSSSSKDEIVNTLLRVSKLSIDADTSLSTIQISEVVSEGIYYAEFRISAVDLKALLETGIILEFCWNTPQVTLHEEAADEK